MTHDAVPSDVAVIPYGGVLPYGGVITDGDVFLTVFSHLTTLFFSEDVEILTI